MSRRFRPWGEPVEGRVLLTQVGALGPRGFLMNPVGTVLVRPNVPVAPYGGTLSTDTFVDPSAKLAHGQHIVAGTKTYIGPDAILNATVGFIKIGSSSEVLSNASIIASPNRANPTNVFLGDKVSIGPGATVVGPAKIGVYGTSATNTGVGPNAVVNGATIATGSFVGALAYVGPGVTIPSGYYVLPGAAVTTQADVSNPAKVEKIPDAVSKELATAITRGAQLADGYAFLYQGQSATGATLGSTLTGVFTGNLAAVEGLAPDPGTTGTSITFEAATPTSPKIIGPSQTAVSAQLPYFKARVTGSVVFNTTAKFLTQSLGNSNAILGDQGPITFKGAVSTGNNVTIASPGGSTNPTITTISGPTTSTTTNGVTTITITPASTTSVTTGKPVGAVTIGANLQAGSHAVILGGTSATYTIGANVTVGAYAVVKNSNIGANVSIGAKSYVSDSTLAAGTIIPPGTIYSNNKVVGMVQW